VSAPEDPPSPLVIAASFVDDQDEIYPTMLGPTLAQLQEKAARSALTGGDIAGYLALVKAFSETCNAVPVEYLGTRPQQIAAEVLPLIAEKLVGLAAWSKLVNDSRKKAAQERNEKLQDMANRHYPAEAKPAEIAPALLKDSEEDSEKGRALHDLLQLDTRRFKLMEEDTLRKIIAKRGERRK